MEEQKTNTTENEANTTGANVGVGADESQAVDTKPEPFAVVVEYADGSSPENEDERAETEAFVKEFYDKGFTEDDMPKCLKSITIKRV